MPRVAVAHLRPIRTCGAHDRRDRAAVGRVDENGWHLRGKHEACPWVRGRADGDRVLRGGAFNNNSRNARCAYRNNNHPDNRNNNIGFRVAVSHGWRDIAGIAVELSG
ncbi:MAG: SUMF1/EgtB/PvdO family nonheme iron enzyme [Chloroflexi bacterium]|nr:SUMF1/EgtB/PvdO family nonheme iron enzyme [Chloroflexota bacterium]